MREVMRNTSVALWYTLPRIIFYMASYGSADLEDNSACNFETTNHLCENFSSRPSTTFTLLDNTKHTAGTSKSWLKIDAKKSGLEVSEGCLGLGKWISLPTGPVELKSLRVSPELRARDTAGDRENS